MRSHRLRSAPEYGVWNQMKQRCTNPSVRSYSRYGGRGIAVCPRWLASFLDFYIDMGPRPSPAYQLDRRDNTGPYSPENCRWVDQRTQQNNRRDSTFLTHDGLTLTTTEWERRLGFKPSTVKQRLRLGWDVTRALTTPTRPQLPRK